MLNCIVGKTSVASFESPDKLKEFSDKDVLKCPICKGELIFCNGNYIAPYFRHKQLSEECNYEDYICGGKYNKVTKEEHSKGIKIMYDRLIKNGDIKNLQLEKQIQETKQRADIYFEYNNAPYVIEFQCSPIQNDYCNRHELYRLNGIKDIWILGNSKFGKRELGKEIRLKVIEKELLLQQEFLIYINTNDNKLDYITNRDISFVERNNSHYGTKTLISTFKLNNIDKIDIDDVLKNKLNNNKLDNSYYYNLLNLSLLGETFLIDDSKKIFTGKKTREVINIEEDNVEDKINTIKSKEILKINKLRDKRFLKCKEALLNPTIELEYIREPFDNNIRIRDKKTYKSECVKIDTPNFYEEFVKVGKSVISLCEKEIEDNELDKEVKNILKNKIKEESFYHYYDLTLTNYITGNSVKIDKNNYIKILDEIVEWENRNMNKIKLYKHSLEELLYNHYKNIKNIHVCIFTTYKMTIYFSAFKRRLEIVVDYKREKYIILENGETIYSKKINDIDKEFKDIINIIIPNILHKIIDK